MTRHLHSKPTSSTATDCCCCWVDAQAVFTLCNSSLIFLTSSCNQVVFMELPICCWIAVFTSLTTSSLKFVIFSSSEYLLTSLPCCWTAVFTFFSSALMRSTISPHLKGWHTPSSSTVNCASTCSVNRTSSTTTITAVDILLSSDENAGCVSSIYLVGLGLVLCSQMTHQLLRARKWMTERTIQSADLSVVHSRMWMTAHTVVSCCFSRADKIQDKMNISLWT